MTAEVPRINPRSFRLPEKTYADLDWLQERIAGQPSQSEVMAIAINDLRVRLERGEAINLVPSDENTSDA